MTVYEIKDNNTIRFFYVTGDIYGSYRKFFYSSLPTIDGRH